MCPLSLEPLTPSHPSRLSQSTGLNSLSHTENSHWLHIVMYMFSCYSLLLSDTLLPSCVQKSFLDICVSFAALQICCSVTSSYIPYGCIYIYIFFFFCITSFVYFLKLSLLVRLVFTSTPLSTWKIMIIAALIFWFFACKLHYLCISRFNWLIFLKGIGCLFFFFSTSFMTSHFEWLTNNHSFYSFGFWIL